MTRAVETPRQLFNCNGSTDTFAIPFTFEANDEVEVIIVDTDTDVETPQVYTTDYTIVGTNVVTVSAHASDKKLLIRMDVDLDQETVFSDQVPGLPSATGAELDEIVAQIQMLSERINRCLTFPKTSTHSLIALPRTIEDEVVPMFYDDGTTEWITRDSLVGEAGDDGDDGDDGTDGTVWTTGSGAPIATAAVGDLYLDSVTGDVWRYS